MVVHARVAPWSWLFCPALLMATGGGCSSSANEVLLSASDATIEGAPQDGPSPPGDASACRPGDVATYRPAPYRPATAGHEGACTPKQIGDFYTDCLGPQKTSALCSAFMSDKATMACAACIVTRESADRYGPIIDHGGFVTPNVAGCIELTESSQYSCAEAVQALSGCELASCEANCPVQDAVSRAAYDACTVQAAQGGCQTFAVAARCSEGLRDAGQAGMCLLSVFQDFYNAVVPLFCGSAPQRMDAGVLPFDAAGSDANAASDASVDAAAQSGDASSDGLVESEADSGYDAQRE